MREDCFMLDRYEGLVRISVVSYFKFYINPDNPIVSKYIHFDEKAKVICPNCYSSETDFYILEPLQYFFCLNCMSSGDVIDFYEDFRGKCSVPYLQDINAISHLGMFHNFLDGDSILKIKAIIDASSEFYQKYLETATVEYLERQGIRRDIIDKFRIGNIGEKWIANYLIKERLFSKELCITSKIIYKNYRDKFKKGIVLPNFLKGRVTGLTCVDLDEPDEFEKVWMSYRILKKGQDVYDEMERLLGDEDSFIDEG